MPVSPDSPTRSKDRFVVAVQEWRSGCLLCEEAEIVPSLPGSDGRVHLPLCARHVRWAMASRRERMGRQSRRLKHLLLAWCAVHGGDREAVHDWLGY